MATDSNRKKDMLLIISLLLSIGSIIISAACLPRAASEETPHYDYLGLVIGVLALFVTFLVAWQIYMTIVSREQVKELNAGVDKIKNEYRALSEQNRNVIMGWHRQTMGDISLEDGIYEDAYKQYIQALHLFVDSSIPLDDPIVKSCLYSMDLCLEEVSEAEKNGRVNVRPRFMENNTKFNQENDILYDKICAGNVEGREFKKYLIHLKDKRLALDIESEMSPIASDYGDLISPEDYGALLEEKLGKRETSRRFVRPPR